MSREMWYLTKGSGIVAAALIAAALLWGFLFSARETGKRLRPNWWLDLHNWLGGLALIFTGVHVLASFLDSNSGIGLAQVFVPGSAVLDRWGIGFGVVATYLLAVVVFTTWPRRLSNRRWWRVLHLASVAGTALALLHAYVSGSDATQLVFRVGLLLAAAVSTYGLGIRLFNLRNSDSGRSGGAPARRATRTQPAHSGVSPTAKPPVSE